MWLRPEGQAYIANCSWMEKSLVVSGFSPHYLWLGRLQPYKSQNVSVEMMQFDFFWTPSEQNTNYILPLRKSVRFFGTECEMMKEIHNAVRRLQLRQVDCEINIL